MIKQSETVTIETNDGIDVKKETLGIKASTFLYNLQQPTKGVDNAKYSKILIALNISPHLVAKKLDQFYLKGPASYGSIKRLQTQSKLPIGKVQSYLESKPSFTKYRSLRLKFPRLKVFVKHINEIWSPDLAHVDKLAKCKRNIKYLLVAVDCLSRYLRVEPLKPKYATEAAEAFKKMIKNKQPDKIWVDDGAEFLGAFKQLCTKRGIHLYSTYSEKK